MSKNVGSAGAEPSGLTLELLPHVAAFRHDDEPEITACLRNSGERALHLVMPGDGSVQGWRTPLIEWAFTPDATGIGMSLKSRVCGNINGIREAEVFTLAPGESRNLGEWIVPSLFPGSAEFSASMIYSNDPAVSFRGIALPAHDEAALALVRESDRCWVQSNEIGVSFEHYPADALRTWFPELVEMLRERWIDGMNCDQLIALRADVQRRLRAVRADRGIQAGLRWIRSDRHDGIRIRQWCGEPEIPVRAVIQALGRFEIVNTQIVSDMEQRWRSFRREHGLDLGGQRTPNKPLQPSSGA